MKLNIDLVIFGILLLGLAVLHSLGFLTTGNSIEHFAASNTTYAQVPECPATHKFFNDRAGNSLCCKGVIDPYKHTCSGTGPSDLCSFLDNIPNPKNPRVMLPLCAGVFEAIVSENSAQNCPRQFRHYADDRSGNKKCCSQPATNYGRECATSDRGDPSKYCVVSGTPGPNEKMCQDVLLREAAIGAGCPSGMFVTPIKLGPREVTAYGQRVANMEVPVCASMTDTCIPDPVITHLKAKNQIYTNRDPATWKYSCSSWSRTNVTKDTTFTPVAAYP